MVKHWKREKVDELQKVFISSPTTAIVNVHGIPAPQMQGIRASLKNKVTITMTRKRIMARALKNVPGKEKLAELADHMDGETAIAFTDLNPFKLYKALEASKVKSPAKPGQTAPCDIIVPEGDTGYPPGPMIGDLGKHGIKSGVQKGTIHITKEKLMVKEGEVIVEDIADILSKLHVEPMELGLDLRAAFEDGIIFPRNTLIIDEAAFLNDIMTAHTWAMNLAINKGIMTLETTAPLLSKAYRDAIALASHIAFLTPETAEAILQKANAQCLSLASEIAGKDPAALSEEVTAALSAQPAAPASAGTSTEETTEKTEAPPEEDEEKKEEEAVSGLGALFG